MADVTLKDIRKIYPRERGDHVAVHSIDLHVADGEFLVLVGPSGCGKSTILRMIAGLEAITEGTLTIGGKVMNDVAPGERDIAMVFQTYALYPHMSVRDNLAFALKLRGVPAKEIDEQVRAAATAMHIESLLPRRPGALSGGERQRVALGRALVRNPQVFLFDEPLSNLDARLRVQMRREIARLHRELRATMIYVTHDQIEAMTLGDRIVVLKDGAVQQVDVPSALYDTPANMFVAGFIGSPSMNLVTGNVIGQSGDYRLRLGDAGELPIPDTIGARYAASADGKGLVIGVRPEHLRVTSSADDPDWHFTVELELIEQLGGETILHGRADALELTARQSPSIFADVGDRFRLRAELSHLHFFDAETQQRIPTPQNA